MRSITVLLVMVVAFSLSFAQEFIKPENLNRRVQRGVTNSDANAANKFDALYEFEVTSYDKRKGTFTAKFRVTDPKLTPNRDRELKKGSIGYFVQNQR